MKDELAPRRNARTIERFSKSIQDAAASGYERAIPRSSRYYRVSTWWRLVYKDITQGRSRSGLFVCFAQEQTLSSLILACPERQLAPAQ